MDNRFNLVDEPWIPVSDAGRVSLGQLFTNPTYRSLGGNPIQKMAVLKLLLAIAQAAITPKDESEWSALKPEGLAQACLDYLKRWHHRFYLFGDSPFLQNKAITSLIKARTKKRLLAAKTAGKKKEAEASGKGKGFGAGYYPDLPAENNTILSHFLIEKTMTDADKALFTVMMMNFAFAGKRVESDMESLAGKVMGSRYSAPAGPSIGGWNGLLQTFPIGDDIHHTLWLNLLTHKNISELARWPSGLGTPPWECPPTNEDDIHARALKTSYTATLVAMSRFILLCDNGIYYLDGINYPSVKEGWYEPSLSLSLSGKEIKVKYANPEMRPWRELQATLSFLNADNTSEFETFLLANGVFRARSEQLKIGCWSAGLKVSSNSGDQSVKQSDDFVESLVWLDSEQLGALWFIALKQEMVGLDELAKTLYGRVFAYFKDQKVDGAKKRAAQATHLFWQLCERDFQSLVFGCDQVALRQPLRRRFAEYVHQAYDRCCPNSTARQLDAWARCRPNLSKYLAQEA